MKPEALHTDMQDFFECWKKNTKKNPTEYFVKIVWVIVL